MAILDFIKGIDLLKRDKKGNLVLNEDRKEVTFKREERPSFDHRTGTITDNLTRDTFKINLKAIGVEVVVSGYTIDREIFIPAHGYGADRESVIRSLSSANVGLHIGVHGKKLNVIQDIGIKNTEIDEAFDSKKPEQRYCQNSKIGTSYTIDQDDFKVQPVNLQDVLKGTIALNYMRENMPELLSSKARVRLVYGGSFKTLLKSLPLETLERLDKERQNVEQSFYAEFAKAGRGEKVEFEKLIKDTFGVDIDLDKAVEMSFDKLSKNDLKKQYIKNIDKDEITLN